MEEHDHLSVSEHHRKLSLAIAGTAGHSWACVMAHYSVYHVARWALRSDARFDDFDALKSLNPHLTPEDRDTDRHHARGRQDGSTGFGVNHLVQLMYPAAAAAYDKLYHASVEVRYGKVRLNVLPPAHRLADLMDEVCANIAPAVMSPGH